MKAKKPRVHVGEGGVRYIKKCRFGRDLAEECDDCLIETCFGESVDCRMVCTLDEKTCDRDSEEGRNYDWILSSE